MEQIVVKTEMQENGEILLFYVDDNEPANDSIENQLMQMHEPNEVNYEVQLEEPSENAEWHEPEPVRKVKWAEEEVQRILVFYIDNKETFVNGAAKKKHLWAVACKTMLIGKNPETCEVKLRNLKHKYSALLMEQQKGVAPTWPLFNLCHQAFHDDTYVQYLLRESLSQQQQNDVKVPIEVNPIEEAKSGVIVIKNVNTTTNKTTGDANVVAMLKLYLKYKKNFQKEYWRKGLWETIAIALGEEDTDYWHKRFLNFKQHYLRMLAKRESDGPDSINWPYMQIFDQIFEDDHEFQKKFIRLENGDKNTETLPVDCNEWNETEKTILVKYYFDCYDEFQDQTIPNNFLWTEVGRLLDKKPETCKLKFEELKTAHLNLYLDGSYNLQERKPLAILFDNIISKDTELELNDKKTYAEVWDTEDIDQLVNFLYENMIVLKDPVCFYVFWPCLAKKLNKSLFSCKKQWEDLKTLYKSILDDKKENPDMQIDWRYIELFDRIFDYGMDTTLLNDFKLQKNQTKSSDKIGVRKVQIRSENDLQYNSDEEEFDERGFTKRTKRGVGDSKAFKILEYYHKNKDRFSTTQRKKLVLWDYLAQQIGISGEQCAHRFRNLKQVYMSYVQREINKPEMPILWPYYALCKKVFGYRAIKSKLKNNKVSEENEEWAPKEIKQIIHYFSNHCHEISNSSDSSKWAQLAREMNKTVSSVHSKFSELQKSYKRLKTMKENHPECKVSWKYYNLFDDVFARLGNDELEQMEVDYEDEIVTEEIIESQDEDDYQCIIVLPEGQELSDINNAQIIVQPMSEEVEQPTFEGVVQESSEEVSQQSSEEVSQHSSEEVTQQISEEVTQQSTSEEVQSNSYEVIQQSSDEVVQSNSYEVIQQSSDEVMQETSDEAMQKTNDEVPVIEQLQKPGVTKWNKRSKKKLLILYWNYIKSRKGREINSKEMWTEIASQLPEKTPLSCKKMLALLKANHIKETDDEEANRRKSLYHSLIRKILQLQPKFAMKCQGNSKHRKRYKDVPLPAAKVELALQYYLQKIEEFTSPKFEKKYLWTELASFVSEPVNKLFNKINYLKQFFNLETEEVAGEKTLFSELLKEIINKETIIKATANSEPMCLDEIEEVIWSDEETEQLLVWYLANLEKFKNPKFVRKYLWIEASAILWKSPLACSKKMTEIRTQYKTIIKENPEELNSWRFYGLCQKIYGTGKKNEPSMVQLVEATASATE